MVTMPSVTKVSGSVPVPFVAICYLLALTLSPINYVLSLVMKGHIEFGCHCAVLFSAMLDTRPSPRINKYKKLSSSPLKAPHLNLTLVVR